MAWWKSKSGGSQTTTTEVAVTPEVKTIELDEADLVPDTAEYDPDYDVVYYRYAGHWAARCCGAPLYKWYSSGIVERITNNRMSWTHCESEQDAWHLCNIHREQTKGAPTEDVYRTPSYDRRK